MDGPYEVNTVAAACLHQFVDVTCLVGRVGLAPVGRAVVRIVLRSVHVFVQLVASIIVDERQAHLMRPWCTVESLHYATQGQVGIVVAGEVRQVHLALRSRRSQNLLHGLDGIEGTTLVIAHDVYALAIDGEEISS